MTNTKQLELWKGAFGDSYAERSTITELDIKNRRVFWDTLIKTMYASRGEIPQRILEIGAGMGANLIALGQLYKDIQQKVILGAIEPNQNARSALILLDNISLVVIEEELKVISPEVYDLVFTCGVLIHVHPAHRLDLMKQIYKSSKRWILCSEYFAPETRELPYRGEKNALWADDYGSIWLDNFPLRLVVYGFNWKRTTGLDNTTFWLFEKTN